MGELVFTPGVSSSGFSSSLTASVGQFDDRGYIYSSSHKDSGDDENDRLGQKRCNAQHGRKEGESSPACEQRRLDYFHM